MTNAKKPHVHAEVIKAWADGAEIECRFEYEPADSWRKVNGYPSWWSDVQYRVKPEAVTVVKYHGILQGTHSFESMNHTTGYHAEPSHVYSQHDKWELIAIVKTTFVDRVPVAVEIVK